MFGGALALLFLTMSREVGCYGEGIVLTGAERWLAGEVPHRDWYANYGPGQFAIVGALLAVFGRTVLVLRLWDLAVRAAILAVVHRILRDRVGNPLALVGVVPCAVWLATSAEYGYPLLPAALLGLWSSSRLAAAPSPRDSANALVAGLLTGCCTWFRYDVGAMLAVAQVAALVVVGWLDRRSPLRAIACHALGCALPVAALLSMFWRLGALPGLLRDLLLQRSYPEMRALPFPGMRALAADPGAAAVYLPIVLLAMAPLLVRWRRGTAPAATDADARFAVHFAALTAVGLAKGIVSISVVHLQLALFAAVVLTFGMLRATPRRAAVRRATIAVATLAVITGCAPLGPAVCATIAEPDHVAAAWLCECAGWSRPRPLQNPDLPPLRRLSLGQMWPAYLQMAQLLSACAEPGERMLIGTSRHDRMFVNPIVLYFLAGGLPATHWHHYDPGVQTTEPIQREMVAEFERAPPRWVVLDPTWDGFPVPNGSVISSGVTLLDDWLRAHYRSVPASPGSCLFVSPDVDDALLQGRLAAARPPK